MRNSAIEVYRCALMFGICLLHTLAWAGLGHTTVAYLMMSCVDGFVFISGWFGINFAWKRLLRLYCVAVWCAIVCALGEAWCSREGDPWSWISVGRMAITQLSYYWFVHAYALLMVLTPFVNATMEKDAPLKTCLPFLVVAFGWSFATVVPGLKGVIPSTPGLGAQTGITLLGVYVVARLARRYRLDERMPAKFLLLSLIPLMGLGALNLVKYNSPVAVGLALVSFLLFRRLPVSQGVGRVALWLGPSMLSVYLLHCSVVGTVVVTRLIKVHPLWSVWSCVLVAAGIFVVSVGIDLLRRGIVRYGIRILAIRHIVYGIDRRK